MQQPLRDVEWAAEQLGVCTATVYRLSRTGELRTVRVGRLLRIRESDLTDFINRKTGTNERDHATDRQRAGGKAMTAPATHGPSPQRGRNTGARGAEVVAQTVPTR